MATRDLDTSWIKQSFMLPVNAVDDADAIRRIYTEAAYKYTDTTVGGSFAINPPPQFTRFADIKMGGMGNLPTRSKTKDQRTITRGMGMGRYYSEALDDNGQYVVMSFGVPAFNSMTSFFGSFYSPEASILARTGRITTGFFYGLGKAVGFVVALPFQPFIIGGQIIKSLSGVQATKYYYLKPAMPLYWNAVNTMANGIAVNMGLISRVLTPEQQNQQTINENTSGSSAQQQAVADNKEFYNLFPDIYSPKGGIDVYAIATRAQRLANNYRENLKKILENAVDSQDLAKALQQFQTAGIEQPKAVYIDEYVNAYIGKVSTATEVEAKPAATEKATSDQPGTFSKWMQSMHTWFQDAGSGISGGRQDGSNYVTFRVDYTGPANESFSNSKRPSDLAEKVNSMAAQGRSTSFNLAGGNISDGTVGKIVGGALEAAKNFVSGLGDAVHLSGLAVLAGAAFVDMPDMWDSASANLPRMDFSMELRSVYGNKLSRFQSLYIPLCMILAGALPLSSGRHAYGAPFLCELYCRGRAQTRLGMIDSISITRGSGNLGWTQEGEPLGIDISFSVVDMSSILHMPIVDTSSLWDKAVVGAGEAIGAVAGGEKGADLGGNLAAALAKGTYSDDNLYNDYLAVLGSLSYTDQVYAFRRWGLSRARQKAAFDSWRSPWHAANWAMGTWPGRIITGFSRGTERQNAQ